MGESKRRKDSISDDKSMSQVPPTPSKFSKFLAKSSASSRKSGSESAPESSQHRKSFLGKKGSRLFQVQDSSNGLEPPVIIEPASTVTAPPRPSTTVTESVSIPSKLSGWLSHLHPSPSSPSASDFTALLSSPSHPTSLLTSPKSRAAAGLITAARHSKTHLDRAMRYIMDSDVITGPPSKESLWLLGCEYPSHLFSEEPNPGWPESFWNDFISIPWLTYRSAYPTPIKDVPLSTLPSPCSLYQQPSPTQPQPQQQPASPITPPSSSSPSKRFNVWQAVSGVSAERTWNSDSGWGCMLRTGQSMLAQALLQLHLGRPSQLSQHSQSQSIPVATSLPVSPSSTSVSLQWTRSSLLSLFLDTPAPTSPFSVHRFAIVGKELGKEIGTWFGPSTAAGGIKKLVSLFPQCGLAVVVATDQSLYETEVFAASYSQPPQTTRTKQFTSKSKKKEKLPWGDKPVLVLIGVKLGIEGVNPVYYECIKQCLRFPWTVGIAGGRPSSSYYFVGYQGDNLFYLDPHYTRNAVIPVVPNEEGDADDESGSPLTTSSSGVPKKEKKSHHWRSSTASIVSRRASVSLSHQRGHHSHHQSNLSSSPSSNSFESTRSSSGFSHGHTTQSPAISPSQLHQATRSQSTLGQGQQPIISPSDLKTYTCDKVRRIPIASMDPSMLLGFLIRSKEEWIEFRASVGKMPKPMFSIVDEVPSWGRRGEDEEEGEGDDATFEMGMESVSDDFDISDEEGDLGGEEKDENENEESGGHVDANRNTGVITPRKEEFSTSTREGGRGHYGKDGVTSGSTSSSGGVSTYTATTTSTNESSRPFPTSADPADRFPIREDDYSDPDSERSSSKVPIAKSETADDDDDDWVDPVQMVTPSSLNEMPGKPYTARTVSSASAMQFSPSISQVRAQANMQSQHAIRHDSLQTIKQQSASPSHSRHQQVEMNSKMFPRTPSPISSKDWVDDFGTDLRDSPSIDSNTKERERERVSTFKANPSFSTSVSAPLASSSRESSQKSSKESQIHISSSELLSSSTSSRTQRHSNTQLPLPPVTRSSTHSNPTTDDRYRFPTSPPIPPKDPPHSAKNSRVREREREKDRDKDLHREKEKELDASNQYQQQRERRLSGLRIFNPIHSSNSSKGSDTVSGAGTALRGRDGGRTTSGGVRARVIESTGNR